MSLADIFSISTVTALISASPSAQTKIWDVLAQRAALTGFIVREGDCLCCEGPSCSRAQREHQQSSPRTWAGLVCHTCCSAVTAKTASAGVTPVHWITHESSAWRAKHFWAGVWNNMKWLGPKTTAKGGKGRLWRQMVSPMDRHSVERGVLKGVLFPERGMLAKAAGDEG